MLYSDKSINTYGHNKKQNFKKKEEVEQYHIVDMLRIHIFSIRYYMDDQFRIHINIYSNYN